MTSFWTHIAKSRVSLGWVARIRGHGTLLASFPQPDSAWLDLDGETYGWHECISADAIEGVSTEIDPWTGLPVAGEVTFGVRLTPTVRAWLDFELAASQRCILTASAAASDTTLTVDTTALMPSAGPAHLGKEAITYTGKTPTTLTGVTRGLFGSRAVAYQAEYEDIQETGIGGPFIATRRLSFVGCIVDLYAVPMRIVDGVRTPYGSSLVAVDNQLIGIGPLVAFDKDYGSGLGRVGFANLAKILEAEVYTRYPSASAGHGLAGFVQVDEDSCRIAWSLVDNDGGVRYVYDERLQRDDGTGTSEDVPFGLYDMPRIGRWVGWTINERMGSASVAITGQGRSSADSSTLIVVMTFGLAGAPDYFIGLLPGAASLWPEMGFPTGEQVEGTTVSEGGTSTGQAICTFTGEAPPQFRLSERGTRRLYYRGRSAEAFVAATNWVDADGAAILGHVLVGEEVLEFNAISSSQPNEIAAYPSVPYLQVSRRAACNTAHAELIVAADDDPEELRQVVAMPSTEWGRALMYLATAGPTYGWRAVGAELDPDLFDDGSFELYGAARRDLVITKKTSLKELLGILLPQTQTAVLSGDVLRLVDLDPITDDEAEDAAAIGTDDTSEVPTWDDGEDRIVNRIVAKNIGYDPGTDKGQEQPIGQGTSAGTWGYQDAVDIDCRWTDDGEAVAAAVFERIVSKFGERFATSEWQVIAAAIGWRLRPTAAALLSHTSLPDGAGGLGLVDRLARIWAVRMAYMASGSPRASVKVVIHDLTRSSGRCRWAPSGRSTSVSGADITLDPDTYSDGTRNDAANFAVGMVVRISSPGTTTSAQRTLTGVVGNVLTCNSAVGIASPVIVEFAGWSAVTTAQQRYAYIGEAKRWS